MYSTNVVVVTNFTENSTSGVKCARWRLLPCYGAKRAIIFWGGKVTYFLCVLFSDKDSTYEYLEALFNQIERIGQRPFLVRFTHKYLEVLFSHIKDSTYQHLEALFMRSYSF